jgi:hypothetical protein
MQTKQLRQFGAIHARHRDIKQGDVWRKRLHFRERVSSTGRPPYFVSLKFQKRTKGLDGVRAGIYEQDTLGRIRARRGRAGSIRIFADNRQAYGYFRSLAFACIAMSTVPLCAFTRCLTTASPIPRPPAPHTRAAGPLDAFTFMDILDSLRQAPSAELYRLYLAIGKMLEDPRRILEIRRRLQLGKAVIYIGDNPLCPMSQGTVIELRHSCTGTCVRHRFNAGRREFRAPCEPSMYAFALIVGC